MAFDLLSSKYTCSKLQSPFNTCGTILSSAPTSQPEFPVKIPNLMSASNKNWVLAKLQGREYPNTTSKFQNSKFHTSLVMAQIKQSPKHPTSLLDPASSAIYSLVQLTQLVNKSEQEVRASVGLSALLRFSFQDCRPHLATSVLKPKLLFSMERPLYGGRGKNLPLIKQFRGFRYWLGVWHHQRVKEENAIMDSRLVK